MKIVVGLGNPGIEYEKSRHNVGRILVNLIEEKITGVKVKFITPDTFMNNSGKAVVPLIKSKKDLKDLIVIYDDIDLPFGKIKISFNRSSGGHNGLESIIKKIKSREFTRIRIGISPSTPSGKLRKPKDEKAVLKFLLGDFKKEELATLKKLSHKVAEAVEMIFTESREKAMSLYN
ncbi:aminoacyl-tRNA hydrolase [Candidatus Nomurabacteria bacterium CG10_big_fil_rev_8_21_14_0_10_35_16]|uniref:Peptidyl-tRNA hydrolase n=1 Tax=Candidatus Nomurabacteria bacterium CG10_big_fil_rev_8_21_14_0_10_35_16 TaxID=1974731 RepID=A0A2H0TB82_9BACT|nr:MAG: aminoacyl-tRNA hydrolase [Candidatus Nomurabacteria bacterium CG10_big_fil_rev_8_21_14_0_10_35_16]